MTPLYFKKWNWLFHSPLTMSSNTSIVSKHIDICFLSGVNSSRQVFIFSSAEMFWCSLMRPPAPVRQNGLRGWGGVWLGLVMQEERGREPEQRFFIFWTHYWTQLVFWDVHIFMMIDSSEKCNCWLRTQWSIPFMRRTYSVQAIIVLVIHQNINVGQYKRQTADWVQNNADYRLHWE